MVQTIPAPEFWIYVVGSAVEKNVARTGTMGDGKLTYTKNWGDGAEAMVEMTEAEKLCFNVLPKDFGVNNAEAMPEVLKSPLWQEVLDFCTVAETMER